MQQIALDYYDSGLHVLPIWKGKKNTTLKTWSKSTRIDKSEIPKIFNGTSIALVCGYASGGVEVIDIDNHFGDADYLISQLYDVDGASEILEKTTIENTPSGGSHIIFKCKKIGNNKKLASRKNNKGRKETLIETRGEGGYIVCYPSPGYTLIQGDLKKINEITIDERERLINACLSLNEWHVDNEHSNSFGQTIEGNGDRPGDLFNQSSVAADKALQCLKNHGWRQARNPKHLIRPGKNIKDGISATFGYVAPGVLNVFSSNAHPFSVGGYTPFQIIAILDYNGDFKKCASDLSAEGYKSDKQVTSQQRKEITEQVKKNLKKGRYLSPTEINDFAEKMDIRADLMQKEIKKAQENVSGLNDYEDWAEVEKVEYFLKGKYKFRVDIIRRVAEMSVNGGAWENLNEHTVYRDLQKNEPKIKFSLEKLKSLLKSDFVERYNPFVDYFEKIKKWDGVDHIKKLCSFFKTDDHGFFYEMLKKQMIRNIKCALDPDYYNRIVFVLVSGEEMGKSYFFMWLNPFGSLYYSDEVLKNDKDSMLSLTETFIRNLEELDGLDKIGAAKLKATISKRGVNDRLPYAANKEYFPRCCSFYGSTNDMEFLLDDKNTRWLPFYIYDIDWRGYSKAVNVHDLWAQAWALYCENYDYELTQEEKEKRNENNDRYRIEDIEESIVRRFFVPDNNNFMTNSEILSKINLKSEGLRINWNTVQLGKTLRRLGYQSKKQANQRGWGISENLGNNDDLPF